MKQHKITSQSKKKTLFVTESIPFEEHVRDAASYYLQVGDLLLLGGQAERANEMYRQALQLSRELEKDEGSPATS